MISPFSRVFIPRTDQGLSFLKAFLIHEILYLARLQDAALERGDNLMHLSKKHNRSLIITQRSSIA